LILDQNHSVVSGLDKSYWTTLSPIPLRILLQQANWMIFSHSARILLQQANWIIFYWQCALCPLVWKWELVKVLKSFYNIIISLFSWIIYNTAQSVCCIPCMYTSGQQSFNDFDFFCVHHHFILKIWLIYAKLWEAHMLIYETMKLCCFKCETFCSMLHWHPNHVWDECVEYFTVYLSGTQFSHTRHSCLFVRLDLSFHTHTSVYLSRTRSFKINVWVRMSKSWFLLW